MPSACRVTVGIPFYAGTQAEHFRLAVGSILQQSLAPHQVHLIQDGPVSQGVEEIVRSYLANYSNVKHLLIPQNTGLSYALNLSILHTSTHYYARMDADDISHSERFRKQVDFLEKHPEIDVLGTWALEFEKTPSQENGFLREMPTTPEQIRAFFHYRNPLVHPSVMFRREVFAKIGLYDTSFRTDQDLELWSRALKKRIGITNLPEALLYLRVDGVIERRSEPIRVLRQARARYRYNTWSPKLNLLKAMTLLFRLMPYQIRAWGYENLR
jgi:glycosyltransferase involved in cell wall biosynthesis